VTEKTVTVDVEKIAALLPEHRVLLRDNLWEFYKVLSNLWEHESRELPEDFRLKLFVAEQYFYNYMLHNGQGPHSTAAQAMAHVKTFIPDRPIS